MSGDRDLPLLHHLQKRRLHFRRGAVDLISQQDVGEDGSFVDAEGTLFGIVDIGAEKIGRQQIGGKLDPLTFAVDDFP